MGQCCRRTDRHCIEDTINEEARRDDREAKLVDGLALDLIEHRAGDATHVDSTLPTLHHALWDDGTRRSRCRAGRKLRR